MQTTDSSLVVRRTAASAAAAGDAAVEVRVAGGGRDSPFIVTSGAATRPERSHRSRSPGGPAGGSPPPPGGRGTLDGGGAWRRAAPLLAVCMVASAVVLLLRRPCLPPEEATLPSRAIDWAEAEPHSALTADSPPPPPPDAAPPPTARLPQPHALPPITLAALQKPRTRGRTDPRRYLIDPEPRDMRAQRKKVAAYLASPAFRHAQEARRQGPQRGIIINAGGSIFLSSSVVQLRVLRRLLNCTLPVELVWHGPKEMDNATLAALQQEFGPLRGYDITQEPYPDHHRHGVTLSRFEGKTMSLMLSHFQEALLLDSDNVPLRNPEELFDSPDYIQYGNLFWPDFWHSATHKELLYDIVGLKYPLTKWSLQEGKGALPDRDTESGQVLLDLNRHADVAQYLYWINSFSDTVYKAVWGDKDTFAVAFAAAGKADQFMQTEVPPGALLSWRKNMLWHKAAKKKDWGFMLIGMLQFDPLGRPAFMHRTINKFKAGGQAYPIDLVTGPLPYRWVHYYIHQESLGPTVGVPWDYVAPPWALRQWSINPAMAHAYVAEGRKAWSHRQSHQGACPVATFLDYWHMREMGLPVGRNASLDAACDPVLRVLWGEAEYAARAAAGLVAHPELVALAPPAAEGGPAPRQRPGVGFDQVPVVRLSGEWHEVGDGTPVAAWAPDYMNPSVDTDALAGFRGAYEAFEWVTANQARFPVIQNGP